MTLLVLAVKRMLYHNFAKRIFVTIAMAFATGLPLMGALAQAVPPQAKFAPPGFYRLILGDFEITALADGTFPLKVSEVISGVAPKKLRAMLFNAFLTNTVDESVNGFLINTGSRLVLIDAGAGTYVGPDAGKLLGNLRASGYQPEQVDEIYITHMHGDHIGGLVLDGHAAFPNAIVRADQTEADYWLSRANRDAASKDDREDFDRATQALQPYVASGKFKAFSGDDVALVPGIRAVAAPGHTPGNRIYVAENKGQTLVLWGDTMHVAAVQFPDPSAVDNYDVDPAAGIAQRKKIFAAIAGHRYWVGGAHLSFPGIGHLRATGIGYTYVPTNYAPTVRRGSK